MHGISPNRKINAIKQGNANFVNIFSQIRFEKIKQTLYIAGLKHRNCESQEK